MAVLLIILGFVIWIFVSSFAGVVLVLLGLILLFVPQVPYGYSSWHRRRAP
jgi:hypothetical protein